MVHIGEDTMRCLGGTSSLWRVVEYRVTIIIMYVNPHGRQIEWVSCAIEGVVLRSSAVVPICYLPSYHWTPGLVQCT